MNSLRQQLKIVKPIALKFLSLQPKVLDLVLLDLDLQIVVIWEYLCRYIYSFYFA